MNVHTEALVAARPRPEPGPPIVRLESVARRFTGTAALDGVSLTVGKGEIVGIIGRSGAGKSTLIRCLNGLERPMPAASRWRDATSAPCPRPSCSRCAGASA